ncbi:hypothetical protein XA68_10960 [Ophiocordyceps unilateralis]|uniref:Dickkopf N-terminal cysteine-rich domain-containing protein n=1 Tax=Ophiocordyceps unilateralis TaxID=268505 RepID=A0A2A9P2E5_OPHUN|nr:hypothetical protein XA68_10960 [Ophiocordyceps unilateralis]
MKSLTFLLPVLGSLAYARSAEQMQTRELPSKSCSTASKDCSNGFECIEIAGSVKRCFKSKEGSCHEDEAGACDDGYFCVKTGNGKGKHGDKDEDKDDKKDGKRGDKKGGKEGGKEGDKEEENGDKKVDETDDDKDKDDKEKRDAQKKGKGKGDKKNGKSKNICLKAVSIRPP